MELCNLPSDLSSLPPIVLQGDPDGVLERAAFALLLCDVVGAARLALTIQNRYRRAVWMRGFRSATITAARESCVLELVVKPATAPAERNHDDHRT